MTDLTLDTLFTLRLGHPLTGNEERFVRSFLPSGDAAWRGNDISRAVAILAKTGDLRYRDVLYRALHATDDPFVAQFAIKGLIRFMDETAEHIPKLIELCRRASFDPCGDTQLVAVQLAADVLAEQDSPLLMRTLISVAENPEGTVILRQDAVASLSVGVERLLGEGEDMPETGAEILALARELTDARHN